MNKYTTAVSFIEQQTSLRYVNKTKTLLTYFIFSSLWFMLAFRLNYVSYLYK